MITNAEHTSRKQVFRDEVYKTCTRIREVKDIDFGICNICNLIIIVINYAFLFIYGS